MPIEIKVPRAVQIRRLHATGLELDDIVKVTKWPRVVVREALAAGQKGVHVQK